MRISSRGTSRNVPRCRAILRVGNAPLMHSRNYEISSPVWRAEAQRARSSDGKSLLLQRKELFVRWYDIRSREWPTWQIIVSRIRATLPLLSRQTAKWGRISERTEGRHFPSETSSRWNIGGLAVLAVTLTSILRRRARDMQFSLPNNTLLASQLFPR